VAPYDCIGFAATQLVGGSGGSVMPATENVLLALVEAFSA
jgi:hypothetical protein